MNMAFTCLGGTLPTVFQVFLGQAPLAGPGISLAEYDVEEVTMLYWAAVFLVIGIISGLLGFTTIAGASIAIAKFLAGLFLVLFIVFLLLGLSAARRIAP
jgi:uncharacterized membrane protein YtjA (UPF0391 family)